jgi:hypothetical protein
MKAILLAVLLVGCQTAQPTTTPERPFQPAKVNHRVVEGPKCPITIVVAQGGTKLLDTDLVTVEQARKRCGELYPASPCTKLIVKIPVSNFRVTCGAKNDVAQVAN